MIENNLNTLIIISMLVTLYISNQGQFDEAIQRAKAHPELINSIVISFDDHKKPLDLKKDLSQLLANAPNLKHLELHCLNIPAHTLMLLGGLNQLKSLVLYWSRIEAPCFFDTLPDTLETINFARTNVFMLHNQESLKNLLERTKNLQELNLGETKIISFPRLARPNPKVKKLDLFHDSSFHACNKFLGAQDLNTIYYNFPNLDFLNLSGCLTIDLDNETTRHSLKAFAAREQFTLCAPEKIAAYFKKYQQELSPKEVDCDEKKSKIQKTSHPSRSAPMKADLKNNSVNPPQENSSTLNLGQYLPSLSHIMSFFSNSKKATASSKAEKDHREPHSRK